MKVFITGVAGFVGAGLARAFVADGHEVHGFVRSSSDLWRIVDLEKNIHLHTGDLLDDSSVRSAVKAAQPDAILHLGVYGAYPTRQTDRQLIFRSSVDATASVLNAAKEVGVGIVVNTGSSSEYGAKQASMSETDLLEPNSFYGVAKAAQTLYCQQFTREEKLPIITLRLFSVYGPYEDQGRFIPTLVRNTLDNAPMPIANFDTARDFVYLADVVEAYRLAVQKPELSGEIFNVGSGVQQTLKEAFDVAVQVTGSASTPTLGTAGVSAARSFDVPCWVANMEKSRSRLGFEAKYSLKEGLTETVQWTREYHGTK